jgi:hypothetical protein
MLRTDLCPTGKLVQLPSTRLERVQHANRSNRARHFGSQTDHIPELIFTFRSHFWAVIQVTLGANSEQRACFSVASPSAAMGSSRRSATPTTRKADHDGITEVVKNEQKSTYKNPSKKGQKRHFKSRKRRYTGKSSSEKRQKRGPKLTSKMVGKSTVQNTSRTKGHEIAF